MQTPSNYTLRTVYDFSSTSIRIEKASSKNLTSGSQLSLPNPLPIPPFH